MYRKRLKRNRCGVASSLSKKDLKGGFLHVILITGAGGKTGLALLQSLVAGGEATRVFVRRPEQAERLQALGATESVAGDLGDPIAVDRACRNVHAIYHIPPNMDPAEISIGENLIRGAETQGVKRFVYHSVLRPPLEAMPHHWQKMRVEELFFQSDLDWTILQPGVYMENILAQWDSILSQLVYWVPYSIDAELSYIAIRDVAEAGRECLLQNGHSFAVYELVGTEPIAQTEVANLIGDALQLEVTAREQSIQHWRRAAVKSGLETGKIESLIAMFRYYDQYGLKGNPNICGWLLGKDPMSLGQFFQGLASES
jgi:uncharacterized protein YbjT (DUF2867 family)